MQNLQKISPIDLFFEWKNLSEFQVAISFCLCNLSSSPWHNCQGCLIKWRVEIGELSLQKHRVLNFVEELFFKM